MEGSRSWSDGEAAVSAGGFIGPFGESLREVTSSRRAGAGPARRTPNNGCSDPPWELNASPRDRLAVITHLAWASSWARRFGGRCLQSALHCTFRGRRSQFTRRVEPRSDTRRTVSATL